MKKHDKSFEDFFRESFEGAEMTPSKHVWDNISNRLDGNSQKRPFYWWAGGIAASILLMFCAYIVVHNPFAETQMQTENNSVVKNIATNPKNIEQANTSQITENTNNTKITTNKNTQTQNTTENTSNNRVAKYTNKENVTASIATNKTTIQNNNEKQSTLSQHKVANKQSSKLTNIATSEKQTSATTVQPLDAKTDVLLNQDFHLLKKMNYIPFASKYEALQMILFPLSYPTSSNKSPKVAIKMGTEIILLGTYNHFNPNFSAIQDNIMPYPFITNDQNKNITYADGATIKNTIAPDLMNLSNINSYSFGILLNQQLYKGFGIRTGMSYTNISYMWTHTTLSFRDMTGVNNTIPNNGVHLQQQTQTLNIPIALAYQMQTGKIIYGLYAGIQTDILLHNTLQNDLYASGNHVYSLGKYKDITLQSLIGLRIAYAVNRHFSLNIEGNYRQTLQSIYDTPYLNAKPQNMSIGMGLGYKF